MAYRPIPAVVSTLTLLALLTAADAWACTAPLVCKPKTSLTSGAQVPANAQAIPVLLPTPLQPPYEPVVPELRDVAGKPVEVEAKDDAMGWTILRPVKGFSPASSYTLHLPSLCKDPSGSIEPPTDVTFTTGPTAPLPASLGTLQLAALPVELVSVWTTTGSCTEAILAARGSIDFAAVGEFAPWRALARAEVRIDGASWANSAYGDLPLAGEAPAYQPKGRTIHAFHVACATVPSSADAGLQPGLHHVELRIHIAGEANDAPDLAGDLSVTCPSQPPVDAGSDSDTADGTDASVGADTATGGTAKPASSSDDGCSASRVGLTSAIHPMAWLIALGLAVVALRRRLSSPDR
jgi:hypothetical protein